MISYTEAVQNLQICEIMTFLVFYSVTSDDYLNTFAFLDKLAENLTKKQAAK